MSYWRLFYHITWSTKGRALVIDEAIAEELYRVIIGKAQELGAEVHAVGGCADHVHLVVSVPPVISLSDFVGQVKGASTYAVNHILPPDARIHWQSEYGIVSFGGKQLDMVVRYVLEQRRHHEQRTTISFLERPAPPAAKTHG